MTQSAKMLRNLHKFSLMATSKSSFAHLAKKIISAFLIQYCEGNKVSFFQFGNSPFPKNFKLSTKHIVVKIQEKSRIRCFLAAIIRFNQNFKKKLKAICCKLPRWSPRGHILKSLTLASKPTSPRKCPALGSWTGLFFDWLGRKITEQ